MLGEYTQPVFGSQLSSVHLLLSSHFWIGVPEHFPSLQTSLLVHLLASSQGLILLMNLHPFVLSHESLVHGLLSTHTTLLPGVHLPLRHLSSLVQALLSEHELVFGVYTQPLSLSHESEVQRFLSLQVMTVPPHEPFLQTSL